MPRPGIAIYRFLLMVSTLLVAVSCTRSTPTSSGATEKLTVGVVTYGEGAKSVEQYADFVAYLGTKTQTLVELEPAFNERKALDEIERQGWGVVFAPPGLAAIAIAKARYQPLFPLQGVNALSSVLVVSKNSPIQDLRGLNGKAVALGQPGSATGYYVPLYTLYGLTLSEIRLAPTPKTVLDWVAQGEVAAGAVSRDELTRYERQFVPGQFRVLSSSPRIPPGAVLVSSTLGAQQQALIKQVLNQAVPQYVQQVGYVPNAAPPDYTTLMMFIEKVQPIEARIHQKPASLYRP